jgi:membrane-associated protease RseP (regulator of RpoE activity)
MTLAGVLFPFGRISTLPETDPQSFSDAMKMIGEVPFKYFSLIAFAVNQLVTDPAYLREGLSFSLSLIFILISHEMGHYVACRLYRVDATLPFFIPTPPMIGPAGTFGAFIKIQSPMPSRRAVFDIGVAGTDRRVYSIDSDRDLRAWQLCRSHHQNRLLPTRADLFSPTRS